MLLPSERSLTLHSYFFKKNSRWSKQEHPVRPAALSLARQNKFLEMMWCIQDKLYIELPRYPFLLILYQVHINLLAVESIYVNIQNHMFIWSVQIKYIDDRAHAWHWQAPVASCSRRPHCMRPSVLLGVQRRQDCYGMHGFKARIAAKS